MKYFLVLKKIFYFIFIVLGFFFKLIFFFVWFFVPDKIRRSLFRKRHRLINRWLKVSEQKKEVFLFFLFVVIFLFFLGLFQVFIIKVKFLFLFCVLLYVGGGFLVIFLYYCVLTFPTFSILDYPILARFMDWYVLNFKIYSGKISGPCWDVFFWYLRVILWPISRFMKRDTSYERHFLISLSAISFVGFLFYIIPSFISEGLDPSGFFVLVTSRRLTLTFWEVVLLKIKAIKFFSIFY